MNTKQRWKVAALQILEEMKHDPSSEEQHVLDRITDRISKWEADQNIAAIIATEFYTWMTNEKPNFHPDETLMGAFAVFWHQQLGKN